MALLLQLTENREIRLEVDLTEWTRAFEQALRNDEVIEVRNPEGGVMGINPRQVLYWKTETEDALASQRQPVPSA
jgi:hypothetical protein